MRWFRKFPTSANVASTSTVNVSWPEATEGDEMGAKDEKYQGRVDAVKQALDLSPEGSVSEQVLALEQAVGLASTSETAKNRGAVGPRLAELEKAVGLSATNAGAQERADADAEARAEKSAQYRQLPAEGDAA